MSTPQNSEAVTAPLRPGDAYIDDPVYHPSASPTGWSCEVINRRTFETVHETAILPIREEAQQAAERWIAGELLKAQHQAAVDGVRKSAALQIRAAFLSLATMYRKAKSLHATDGWVIFYGDKPFAWNFQLNPAKDFRPGCVAIHGTGAMRSAIGGNVMNGAERWEVLA